MTRTETYRTDVIELERIIAAVWNTDELGKHIEINGTSKRITVIQKEPCDDSTEPFIPNGRYLCWLKLVRLSEAERETRGLKPSAYYEPVMGKIGYAIHTRGIPGAVLLNRNLRELYGDVEYERGRKLLGKDPEWYNERNNQLHFGIADPAKIVEDVTRFTGLMVQGKDNDEELRRLSQSPDAVHARIASFLLEFGKKARRFRFVDMAQRSPGSHMKGSAQDKKSPDTVPK